MTNINNYILSSYPTVNPFVGLNAVEDKLVENGYIVAIDNNEFVGILTPNDLIKRRHKLVVDCLTNKEKLQLGDSIDVAFEKFNQCDSSALPAFDGDRFVGIVHREFIIENLKNEIQDLYQQSKISYNLKDSFLRYLSHEIRTPMNSILGFMDLLSELEPDDFEKEMYQNIIRENSEHFLLTMDDLINFARLRAGDPIELEQQDVDLGKIIPVVKEFLESKLYVSDGIKVKIDCDLATDIPTLKSDERKIRQILYHLVLIHVYRFSCNKIHVRCNVNGNELVTLFTGIDATINPRKIEIFNAILNNVADPRISLPSDIGSIELQTIKKLADLLGTIEMDVQASTVSLRFAIPLSRN